MQDPAPLADGLEADDVAVPASPSDDATYAATVAVPGYRGADRRRPGVANAVRRALYGRSLSARSLQAAVALSVLAAAGAAGAAGFGGSSGNGTPGPRSVAAVAAPMRAREASTSHPVPPTTVPPTTVPPPTAPPTTAPPTAPPTTVPPPTAPPTTAPPTAAPPTTVPPTTAPASTAPPTAAPPPAAPAAAPPATATPQQLGADALTLVRYPWQRIPGYSIQFLPIADAPSPGFYGNTTFTWGQAGGTSTLYVFPGETVQQLAGIVAFEIGHEVDAAAVDPQGGHAQIENILGIHPASWAPNCDCAEQNFLSGWYAAAFSAYWSPGVGQWSNVAPMPTGATLAAVEPWLNPTIG